MKPTESSSSSTIEEEDEIEHESNPPEIGELWEDRDGNLWRIRDRIKGNFCWAVAIDKSRDCQFHWYAPGENFVNCGWKRADGLCVSCWEAKVATESEYILCERCRGLSATV